MLEKQNSQFWISELCQISENITIIEEKKIHVKGKRDPTIPLKIEEENKVYPQWWKVSTFVRTTVNNWKPKFKRRNPRSNQKNTTKVVELQRLEVMIY